MHRLKNLSKKIMAMILAAELIAAAGMVLDILYTVYLTQQNARLQKQAEAIAVDLVQNQIAGEVTGTAKRTKKTGADLIEKAYVRRIAKKAENLEYVPASTDTNIGSSEVYDIVQSAYSYSGGRLSRSSGTASGPTKTNHNLNMSAWFEPCADGKYGCLLGTEGRLQNAGNYIMVAANLSHPRDPL